MNDLDAQAAVAMISSAADELARSADSLSRLDAVSGDGDHGANVAAAFTEAARRLADGATDEGATGSQTDGAGNRAYAGPGAVFSLVGRSFSEGGGGAAGALFGTLFATLGQEAGPAPAIDADGLFAGLSSAASRVGALGQSARGDKTLLDALLPAIDAGRASAAGGGSTAQAIAAAALAARRGAHDTVAMPAKAGRARYTAGGAVGTPDPGAMSVALIFESWAVALRDGARSHGGKGAATTRASRLGRLATPTGQFAILALDHGRSFAVTLRPTDPDSATADEVRELKDQLIAGLAAGASAILIDPAQAVSRMRAGIDQPAAGLIVGLEDGDYSEAASAPRLQAGWAVERAAGLGADAVKISFEFEPDEPTTAAEQFVRETVRQCDLAGLPLFIEPLAALRGRDDARRRVLEGVRRFGSLGADVLKIQFPSSTATDHSRASWADACAEANALSPVPWALLSEGRDIGEFRELLTIACQAGASGFLAGRAIWGGFIEEGHALGPSEGRLRELRSIADSNGYPWHRMRQPHA